MKVKSGLVLLLVVFAFAINVYAQEQESAAESAERLKMQLLELQARESDLRARLQELDESIKPENIERSLAGVGSTRPEELREARRRQLSIQRDGVLAQIQTLETSRMRLETAIANAEVLAYQQSARRPDTEQSMLGTGSRYQWIIFGGGGLAVLALGGGGALLYRRNRRKMIT
jgi:hypothetical protein